MEVEHPAAKVLVELADLQDQEVGDGTTSVVSESSRRERACVINRSRVIVELCQCSRAHSLSAFALDYVTLTGVTRVVCPVMRYCHTTGSAADLTVMNTCV